MTATRIAPRRRTQAERTATTRTALLDAAVAALAELGFAGASTTEIARRAGVSRGAQLHHFPSKLELVSAALDHVFAEREAEFRRRFGELPPGARTQAGAVTVLWEISQGAEQLAVLELLTAARSDADLRPLARQVLERFEAAVSATFAEVLPDVAADPFLAQRVLLALSVIQGAALHHHLGMADEAEQLVGTLAMLADLIPFAPADATTVPVVVPSGVPVPAVPTDSVPVAATPSPSPPTEAGSR